MLEDLQDKICRVDFATFKNIAKKQLDIFLINESIKNVQLDLHNDGKNCEDF